MSPSLNELRVRERQEIRARRSNPNGITQDSKITAEQALNMCAGARAIGPAAQGQSSDQSMTDAEVWAQSSVRIKQREAEPAGSRQNNVESSSIAAPAAGNSVPTIHPAWAKSNDKLQALREVNHEKTV